MFSRRDFLGLASRAAKVLAVCAVVPSAIPAVLSADGAVTVSRPSRQLELRVHVVTRADMGFCKTVTWTWRHGASECYVAWLWPDEKSDAEIVRLTAPFVAAKIEQQVRRAA